MILTGFSPGGNTVRDERDKPFDPFGVDNSKPDPHHHHHPATSSLTNHNSLSIGRPVTSQLNLPQTKDKGTLSNFLQNICSFISEKDSDQIKRDNLFYI